MPGIGLHTMFEFNGEQFPDGFDSAHGIEPWKTDGTSKDAKMVDDIEPELTTQADRTSGSSGSPGGEIGLGWFKGTAAACQ